METTIGGNVYRTGKLTPFQQFHVARRLAPALWALGSAAEHGGDGLQALRPLAEAMAKMSDADSEYVLNACLSVVHRQQGSSWAPVHAANGGMMFQDIGLAEMMNLTVAVVKENLGNFFEEAPAGLSHPG